MEFVDRFWLRVQKGDGCWEWQGERTHNGYGRALVIYGRHTNNQRRGYVRAHRFAWLVAYGPIPDGLNVLHHCDNPPCVNPAHLFLGTTADNVADMVAKGRQGPNTVGANAKLNAGAVREIRRELANGTPQRRIALQYGVGQTAINDISVGRTWRHVA